MILFCSLPLWKGRNEAIAGSEAVSKTMEKANTDIATEDVENAEPGKEQEVTEKTKSLAEDKPLTLREIFSIPGAREIMIAFFCYCAIESTAGLWASSYLVLHHGVDAQVAAGFASLFYVGITVGRGINGFLTIKFTDTQMIHIGQGIILAGALILFLPLGEWVAFAGLILMGLGC